jgi:hypothetical protein
MLAIMVKWVCRLTVVIMALGVTMASMARAGVEDYNQLLARYVSQGADGVNRVDYAQWKATASDTAALEAFVAEQQNVKPSDLEKAHQFAYWANLYNAVTIKLILDRYPVASIRDIKSEGVWLDPKAFIGPWVAKRVTVEGRVLSLDDIEHTILRPQFNDPRVHYAVNCASLGCPNLRASAWRAETLDADLESAARDFINHPRGAAVGADGALEVSSIYVWFKSDFGGSDEGVIAHLRQFAAPALANRLKGVTAIGSDQYDWSINDIGNSKGNR